MQPKAKTKRAANARRSQHYFDNEAYFHSQRYATRMTKAELFNPAIVKWWTVMFDSQMARRIAFDEVIARQLPPRELVISIVDISRKSASLRPIPGESEVWKYFTPRIFELLASVITGTFVAEDFPDAAIYDPSPHEDTSNCHVKFYIREGAVDDLEAIHINRKFLLRFPAEAPETIFKLLLLGDNLDEIQLLFSNSLKECGNSQAVDEFIFSLKSRDDVDRIHGTEAGAVKNTLYAGKSIATDAAGRESNDSAFLTNTKLANFCSITDARLRAFHLPFT
jgi:hypothetical protein